jgi:NAD(P)-dependent dehydrogenase (short-subunit alcohol dehydrogenase family)
VSAAKVAAVVGAGPGLGAAVAERFARAGFAVALMARKVETLAAAEAKVAAHGAKATSIPADASSALSLAAAFEDVRKQLGDPDVLVYNAGAFHMGNVLDVTPELFESCWRANCLGAFLCAREVLPKMLERKAGTILLTGATASMRGSAGFSCLSVGKFGLRALAQSMARELSPKGIHVAHVIVDGQIDTPRMRSMMPDRPASTLLDPAAIAKAYLDLHEQDPTAWTLELDLRPALEKF